ncbi:hypothetical protein EC973_007345 [Apophysomyces ossiformis]|uniref:RRM domain-containing protein n=1 Tax=Apophysomyces ossiformis TaxID=679940 RepID=A0A8H7BPU6_9FUNG|nr:hypothetical protein EC973_007345 [Apophysomyces ossiformis]
MDLDSSLDDIIKKKQQQRSQDRKPSHRFSTARSAPRPAPPPHLGSMARRLNFPGNQRTGKVPLHTRSKSISKSPYRPPDARTNIPRSSSSSSSRPLLEHSTKPLPAISEKPIKKPDPSKIVITKAVSRRALDPSEVQHPRRQPALMSNPADPTRQAPPPIYPPYQQQQHPISIRGLSQSSSSIPSRNEPGPAFVLISNLDPGANAEDVKAACAPFGPVAHCEIFVDRSGHPCGEAEVEFMHSASALECVAKLDREIADGRVLRACIVNKPANASYTRQHVARGVIAPTRSGYTSAPNNRVYPEHTIPTGPAAQEYARYGTFSRY